MSDVAKLLPLSALVALVLVGAAPGGARVQPRTITVMTRNLYLGANLDPILQAKSFPDALGAVATRWRLVQANDFRVRARAIAHEIQTVRPDVVGFQELVLYRTQTPSDFLQSSARSVVLDYKAELQHALRARKLGYHFVGVDTNTDAELPSGSPATMDIRLTVRNGLLVKNGVRIRNVRIGNFRASDPVIPGLVTATRGWVSADATVGGRTFRLIVTHLESFKPAAVAEAQSLELIGEDASAGRPARGSQLETRRLDDEELCELHRRRLHRRVGAGVPRPARPHLLPRRGPSYRRRPVHRAHRLRAHAGPRPRAARRDHRRSTVVAPRRALAVRPRRPLDDPPPPGLGSGPVAVERRVQAALREQFLV